MPGFIAAALPVLARIGYYGGVVEGARYLWKASARVTGGTPLEPLMGAAEAFARNAGAELGPLDPFKILDEETGLFASVAGAAQKLQEAQIAGRAAVMGASSAATESSVLRDCKRAAGLRASQRNLNVGAQDQSIPGIRDAAKRRYAELSERFSRRAMGAHKQAPDSQLAKRLAGQSLNLAEMSRQPPADPRKVLSGAKGLKPSGMSAISDMIDAFNRKDEPNMDHVEKHLLEAFHGETMVGGNKDVGCCDACAAKKGSCASGSCGVTADPNVLSADVANTFDELSNDFKFGPSGTPATNIADMTEFTGDEEVDPSNPDGLFVDDDSLSSLEDVSAQIVQGTKKGCATGSCGK